VIELENINELSGYQTIDTHLFIDMERMAVRPQIEGTMVRSTGSDMYESLSNNVDSNNNLKYCLKSLKHKLKQAFGTLQPYICITECTMVSLNIMY
jgi:hypothetical protein